MGIFSSKPAITAPPELKRDPKKLSGDYEKLRASLSSTGTLLLPDDTGYEFARTGRTWNYDSMGAPSGILQPGTVDDVAACIKYAADNQIKLCIAGGRHSHLCMLDDSLVCDFSLWTNVEIDSDAKTATVQPGCLWGHVDAACAPYGLAVTGGHDPSTGVAGLTLHGGHGYLERLHGLTVDNLISLEVVSADGTVHKASEGENQELFWALRGGGGNFGVVTEFKFRLHALPNGGMILGGDQLHFPIPFYPFASREAILNDFFELCNRDDIPDEFYGGCVLTPLPVVRQNLWFGSDVEEGKAFFKKNIRNVGYPLIETTKMRPYHTDIQTMIQGPDGMNVAPAHYYMKGVLVNRGSPELAKVLAGWATKFPNKKSVVISQLMGGKASRVDIDSTAVAHRTSLIWVIIIGKWDEPESEKDKVMKWVRALASDLSPFSDKVYGLLPASPASETEATPQEAMYGKHLARLQQIKAKYDPQNLFSANFNLTPADTKVDSRF